MASGINRSLSPISSVDPIHLIDESTLDQSLPLTGILPLHFFPMG